ncbi:MAG: thioredoxin [Gemmataceae bacterium]|nr:thioredoxin [Gemmataceae bacterium]
MTASQYVFDVTEKDFETAVLEKSKEVPVVVDFWAPWCGPCQSLTPVLVRQVESRSGDVLLAKVNTDEQQRLAMAFQIQSLPTVIAFRDGKPMLEFEGALPEPQLANFFDQICPSEAEKEAKQAHDVEKKDPDQAERMFRDALSKEPKQEEALLGLARLMLERNRDAEAVEFLDQIEGGIKEQEAEEIRAKLWLKAQTKDLPDEAALRSQAGTSNDAAIRLGLRLATGGNYEAALEALLAVGEKDFKLATTKVKEAMVKVFQIVGPQNALSNAYRAKLATLLY